jgi:hypothetical protein
MRFITTARIVSSIGNASWVIKRKDDMMKDHEGDSKQYYILGEAWYASVRLENSEYVHEVMFGYYAPEGGSSGEMGMRWYNLSSREGERCIPRLEVFCDAWHALAQFKDVIDALAEQDDEDITVSQFCQLLERCGFTDATPREEP